MPPICGQMVEAMARVAGLTHAWLGRWGRGGGREGVQGRWRGQVCSRKPRKEQERQAGVANDNQGRPLRHLTPEASSHSHRNDSV